MPTYHVTPAGGGDSSGDSKVNAFTLLEAIDTAAAGDLFHIYGDVGDYTDEYVTGGAKDCVMFAAAIGAAANPIVWQGCFDTPGDGGIATIDASINTLAHAGLFSSFLTYNVYKNLVFEGATDHGVDCASDDDGGFKNCRFTNNGGHGLLGDNGITFECCSFDNNSARGLDVDSNGLCIACIAYANSLHGIYIDGITGGMAFECLVYNNGSGNTAIRAPIVLNCTTDGENQATTIGINITWWKGAAVNNIVHDHATGIVGGLDYGENAISRNNLYNSNIADVSNFLAVSTGNGVGNRGDVSAAPGFTDEAGDDYTLAPGSAAISAGLDAKFTVDFWDSFIGAVNPPSP